MQGRLEQDPEKPNSVGFLRKPPVEQLADFIQYFWSVKNEAKDEKEFSILPDGFFDIIFRSTNGGKFEPVLSGLYTEETSCLVPGDSILYAISFKILAVDFLLGTKIASLINTTTALPRKILDVSQIDFGNLDRFAASVTPVFLAMTSAKIDPQKQKLSHLLYSSQGDISVGQISAQSGWSSRQINRYFSSRFGISLKAYCNILRFRSSFEDLKKQQVYPEKNYYDQSHYIKEAKKYSGATPGELSQNEKGKFIQIATLPAND